MPIRAEAIKSLVRDFLHMRCAAPDGEKSVTGMAARKAKTGSDRSSGESAI